MPVESNRYDPTIHGEPNTFISDLSSEDPKFNLRKSSVLAAAFTPFIRSFEEQMSDYPPSQAESIKENTEIGIYDYHRASTAVSEVFDSKIDNSSTYFSSFSKSAESRYLGNKSFDHPLDSLVIVPVGLYGERFAKATAMSGSVLSELAGRMMKKESEKLLQSPYEKIIREDTFTRSPHTSLAEGIQTIAAGIGLLTSDGIPGYNDDPIKGMQQLINQKVFQHFAAQAPTGIIIPMTIVGLRFKEPLISDEDGNLKINSQLKEIFKKEKQVKLEKKGRGTLSEGCPVARPNIPEVTIFGEPATIPESGVQTGMNVFMDYLKYYYSEESY